MQVVVDIYSNKNKRMKVGTKYTHNFCIKSSVLSWTVLLVVVRYAKIL